MLRHTNHCLLTVITRGPLAVLVNYDKVTVTKGFSHINSEGRSSPNIAHVEHARLSHTESVCEWLSEWREVLCKPEILGPTPHCSSPPIHSILSLN